MSTARSMTGQLRYGAVFVASLMVAGCGGGDGAGATPPVPAPVPTPAASATITAAAGGTLTSLDGKVTLSFPPGAVAQDTQVTITARDPAALPANLQGADGAYELGPDGLRFAQPVRVAVKLPVQPRQPDGSLRVPMTGLAVFSSNVLESVVDLTLTANADSNTLSVSGTLAHFSTLTWFTFRLGDPQAPIGELAALLAPALPDTLTVGKTERPLLEVWPAFTLGLEPVSIAGTFRYRDFSQAPLRHLPFQAVPDVDGFLTLLAQPALSNRSKSQLDGFGEYVCDRETLPGERAFFSVSLRINDFAVLLPLTYKPLPAGYWVAPKPLKVIFETAHRCVAPLPPPPPPTGSARVIPVPGKAEGMSQSFLRFGLAGERTSRLWIASALAVVMFDLEFDTVLRTLGLPEFPSLYDVFEVEGSECLRTVPFSVTCWDPASGNWGATQIDAPGASALINAGRVFDTPVQGPNGMQHLVWEARANSQISFERRVGAGTQIDTGTIDPTAWYNTGGPRSGQPRSVVFSPAFAAPAGRALVAVAGATAAQPGQLWYGDPNVFRGGSKIGDLGNDPRGKLRCLFPICAVPNYGSGSVTVIAWNGVGTPVIAGAVPGGNGSVGIDLRNAGNGRYEIVSTGYNDNTVTLTRVDQAGAMLANVTKAVPAGCTNPGHAIFVIDPLRGDKVAVSCNGVDAQGRGAIVVIPDIARFFAP